MASVFVPLLPLNGPLLTDPKKPFVNDYIQWTLVVATSSLDQQAACASATGLVTVTDQLRWLIFRPVHLARSSARGHAGAPCPRRPASPPA